MRKNEGFFNSIRYWLIEFLAKDMPIILNMNVCRPKGYTGLLLFFPNIKKSTGICCNNILYGYAEDVQAILTPKRDVTVKDYKNETS